MVLETYKYTTIQTEKLTTEQQLNRVMLKCFQLSQECECKRRFLDLVYFRNIIVVCYCGLCAPNAPIPRANAQESRGNLLWRKKPGELILSVPLEKLVGDFFLEFLAGEISRDI